MQTARLPWREVLAVYAKPQVLTLLLLGFSAGLPYLLVFSTLSARLTEAGISRALIGVLSWVGIVYSFKVLWAPLADRLSLPFLTGRLGRRRAWIMVSQLGVGGGLAVMAMVTPQTDLPWLVAAALFVAFMSATQDVAIDAYRIECAEVRQQAALAAAYILGYRVALLFSGAGALYLAEFFNWRIGYLVMASGMSVGLITVLAMREPRTPASVLPHRRIRWRDFTDPVTDLFRRYGRFALWILVFVGLYRVSDITMGVMALPFYLDSGYTKTEIADVSKIFGFFMTIAGAATGGLLAARFGVARLLPVAGVLIAVTNLLFVYLAHQPPDMFGLAVVICADNISGGMATSVFVAYLSGLTQTEYTATQYALFSSLMTLPAKFIGGFSGVIVESVGYSSFFIYTAALGAPAVFLAIWFLHRSSSSPFPQRREAD